MVDYQIEPTAAIMEKIRSYNKELVFDSVIEMNTQLAEAPSFGKTVLDFDTTSPVAKSFRRLAQEVLDRCKQYR
jgi:chromosome partitioning protein